VFAGLLPQLGTRPLSGRLYLLISLASVVKPDRGSAVKLFFPPSSFSVLQLRATSERAPRLTGAD
jgi:hypothetical protein